MPSTTAYIIPFTDLTLDALDRVGGKNASLGEMIGALSAKGVSVPDGFALTVDAFRVHVERDGLFDTINRELETLDVADVRALAAAGAEIRRRVHDAPLPADVRTSLMTAYRQLSAACGEAAVDVAVRSSATAEDLPTASFAGQQDTYLCIRGEAALDDAVRGCMASLYTDRAIAYRAEKGIAHRDVLLSVGVQRMVRSDDGSAGVIFTLDTESGCRDVVVLTGAWGLGEILVQGRVNPDEFWVHKPTAAQGFRSIIRRDRGEKAAKLVRDSGGTRGLRTVRVPIADRRRFVLDDDDVLTLARWAMTIETHYTERAGRPTPMDIEWAKDGRTGELFILQARPETVHAQATSPTLALYRLRSPGRELISGKSVGNSIASGRARVIHDASELHAFQTGEILVAEMTDPDWNPVLQRAAAVVTDQGGRTCHAAIVARELGIPCVVGTGTATHVIRDGLEVTVSCAAGDVGVVYDGIVPFDIEELDPSTMPESPVPLMLNLASPDRAFDHARLPCAGVGLMRIEFLVNSVIGAHPMALAHPERVQDPVARKAIRDRAAGYASPAAFFIEQLALGVGQIAAAFYPRPVIVRFSDFKTDEYANLIGGAAFEPEEANPMLGFRGASRYSSEHYRDGFALECAAIRRVRGEMGLTNVKVMIPFCRTVQEGRRVLAEMARNDLRRGQDGLEVYVMCEIPNNVMRADAFSELFDGFSIGSNDLTQLALGIDRNSDLLADAFDERDPGVKRLIEMVVATAHEHGRPVGICGQAPSDHPEFAAFLMSIGIDSMSLMPDALPGVARRLAAIAVSDPSPA